MTTNSSRSVKALFLSIKLVRVCVVSCSIYVSSPFPLIADFHHSDDGLPAMKGISRRRRVNMHMHFIAGNHFFLGDAIAGHGVGPCHESAADLLGRSPLHFT